MSEKNSGLNEEQLKIYQKLAEPRYKSHLQTLDAARKLQQEYGKWLLATLVLINAGAVVSVAGTDQNSSPLFVGTGLYFILGLFFALASGFFAWLNSCKFVDKYTFIAQPNMLHGPEWDLEKNAEGKDKDYIKKCNQWIKITFRGAVITGLLSAVALIVGAVSIWLLLRL